MLAFGYISLKKTIATYIPVKKTIATYITELIDICLDDFASTQMTNKLLKNYFRNFQIMFIINITSYLN